jgi:hypothetical protein
MSLPAYFGRLLSIDQAVAWREDLRAEGRTVVFTNGCFTRVT